MIYVSVVKVLDSDIQKIGDVSLTAFGHAVVSELAIRIAKCVPQGAHEGTEFNTPSKASGIISAYYPGLSPAHLRTLSAKRDSAPAKYRTHLGPARYSGVVY